MHFEAIKRVPGDPILGLMEAFAKDGNPDKFDLGVGVFKDAQGLTPVPAAVKQAEQCLVDRQQSKSYVGGHGDPAFGRLLCELVLGNASPQPNMAGPVRLITPLPRRHCQSTISCMVSCWDTMSCTL